MTTTTHAAGRLVGGRTFPKCAQLGAFNRSWGAIDLDREFEGHRLAVGDSPPPVDCAGCLTVSAPAGIKHDGSKARWDLVPWGAMIEVVAVLTHGAEKYAPDNWRKVPDHRRRYLAAALRHITAWAMGEIRDTESGRPHLAHAVCCLLFLIELEGETP